MALFMEHEHAQNPPSTWAVVKVGRAWQLRTSSGTVISTYPRKGDAEKGRQTGRWVEQYEKEARYYRGEPVPGWKPYVPRS